MRRYRGFVNFLRLHGSILEVSSDFKYVIAHDPKGRIAPFRPTQKLFKIEERVLLPDQFDNDHNVSAVMVNENMRKNFQAILGNSQIPTSRKQIVLLDPDNALLNAYVLFEEISEYLPNFPIRLKELMHKLPPLLRAALSCHYDIKTGPFFIVFEDKGVVYIQPNTLPLPKLEEVAEMSLDSAIEELLAVIPENGATARAVMRGLLSQGAVLTLKRHFGGIYEAAESMPEFIEIDGLNKSILDRMLYRRREASEQIKGKKNNI